MCCNYAIIITFPQWLFVWREEIDRDSCRAVLEPRHPLIYPSEPNAERFNCVCFNVFTDVSCNVASYLLRLSDSDC